MIKMYYEKDCELSLLSGKTVAVLGYGSQGHAHAQNLRDSSVNVIVGLKKTSARFKVAQDDGFQVYETAEAAKLADVVMMLIPDHVQSEVYDKDIKPNLKECDILMFAHGFAIHFNQINPPKNVDVIMVAPKGPGHTVRSQYKEGKGVAVADRGA